MLPSEPAWRDFFFSKIWNMNFFSWSHYIMHILKHKYILSLYSLTNSLKHEIALLITKKRFLKYFVLSMSLVNLFLFVHSSFYGAPEAGKQVEVVERRLTPTWLGCCCSLKTKDWSRAQADSSCKIFSSVAFAVFTNGSCIWFFEVIFAGVCSARG